MIVGLGQINICWQNQRSNMNKCEIYIKEAASKNVDLLVFPEMSLTGFTMNLESHGYSENEIVQWFKKQAEKYKIYIGFGYAIKVDDKGENKYAIVSDKGELLINYKKIHPFSIAGETEKYSKGKEIKSCSINGIMVTPFICYDVRFPEVFQIASKKSKLIIVGANWPNIREKHWIILLKARAIENQCFVVGVNRVGNGDGIEYGGASVLVDPNGEVINEISSQEDLIIGDLNFDKVTEIRKEFNIKADRREELYIEEFKKILTF